MLSSHRENRPWGDDRHRALVLVGKPATGKGTQSRVLGAAPGLVHVESGRILRALGDSSSERAEEVRQLLAQGALVPDELVLSALRDHLRGLADREDYEPGRDLLVLDGIPRNVAQAEELEGFAEVELVLHLRCEDDEALVERARGRRRSQRRADDRDETLRQRLRTYAHDTAPVLAHYESTRRLDVDALQHPLVVHDHILHAVIPLVTYDRPEAISERR